MFRTDARSWSSRWAQITMPPRPPGTPRRLFWPRRRPGVIAGLAGPGAVTDPRQALARALGDPSLALGYWFAAESRYVDRDGGPVELPRPESGRRSTVVEQDGQPAAVLIHDRALEHDPGLVGSVCATAGPALANERMQAELRARLVKLRAQLDQVQASRARLVKATDAQWRQIERKLHDGAQQRLVSIAMSLGLLDSKLPADPEQGKPIVAEARQALAAALAELRELTWAIHPAILTERGLPGALDELGRRAAVPVHLELTIGGRLPEQVETAAYHVVSEVLTNAARHAQASEVRVAARCTGGLLTIEVADDVAGGAAAGPASGLRELADRVEALGGQLSVSSLPGAGTRLRAELPCGEWPPMTR
jgi:signal transduction histidine kinase